MRVQGSEARGQGSGCREGWWGGSKRGAAGGVGGRKIRAMVKGSGFRVQDAGFRVQGSGCRVQGAGFRVQNSIKIGGVRLGIRERVQG